MTTRTGRRRRHKRHKARASMRRWRDDLTRATGSWASIGKVLGAMHDFFQEDRDRAALQVLRSIPTWSML